MRHVLSNLPLERHFRDTRDALARVREAAGGGRAAREAIEGLEARLASLEADLVEREAHLQSQRDLNPQLQWIADSAGSLISMTGRWDRLTGMPHGSALGDGWRASLHPEDLHRYDDVAREAIRGGTGYEIDFRVRTAEGDYRWLRSRAVPRADADGKLLFVYGYTEDVHEQVTAVHALRESEEHLRYTIELNPQLPFRANAVGEVVEVSTKWMKVIGANLDSLLGLGSVDFVHPDDAERVRALWGRSIETGEPLDSRYRIRTAKEGYRWFRSQARPRFDAGGKIIAWYGVAEDIDQQVRASDAMAEAVERYRLAGRATKDVIYDWDLGTGEIQWNDAIELLGGADASGIDWWVDRIHPEDRDSVLRNVDRFIGGGADDWRFDYRFRRADGSWSHVYDRAHMLRSADGAPKRVIGSMTDLTERDEAEKKVQDLRAELIHVSRLSAMGTMAATLAHELNQPLAAAQNWVSAARAMVARVPGVPAQALDALGEGRATILRAGEIIRRIRKLVAGGAVSQASEDLGTIVDESLDLLKVGAGNRDIVFEVALPPVRVFVDRVQIQQVLLNLMRNSLEAMRRSEERRLKIGARIDGGWAEIMVSDTGIGLEDTMEDTLFTPFRTTKADGLGVGLSICRTIIEAHGGRIRVTSVPGSGTCVYFTVPMAAPGSGTDGEVAAGAAEVEAGGR